MKNAFDLSGPSLIAKQLDPIRGKLSRSQVATLAVQRKEKRTGVNPGTIHNLSPASEAQLRPRKGRVL